VVTSALTGLLLTMHFIERAISANLPRLHPAGWWLLPFLGYAALNVQWVTPVRWLGWMDWWGWAQMTAVFWVVLNGVRSRGPRMILYVSLVILGCGLVLFASYQRFVAPDWLMLGRTQATQFQGRSSGSFGLPNSLASFLLLLLPTLGALTIRRGASAAQRVLWGYLTVAFGVALILTISRGAWLALGVVLALCPAVVVRGSAVRRLTYVGGAWLSLGLVAGAIYSTVPAVRNRIELLRTQSGELSRPIMWRAAWSIFRERPLLGGGAGSYGVRFDRHRPETFQLEARWAHNDYLNTLSDYGVVGMTLVIGAWSVVFVGCARGRWPAGSNWFDGQAVTAGLAAGAAAFALQLTVDFSLKIPALAMSFAVVAAMVVQRMWLAPVLAPMHPRTKYRRNLAVLMAAGVAGVTGLLVVPLYRGEGKRQAARQQIDRMAPGRFEPQAPLLLKARDELIEATKVAPENGYAWADVAYVTALLVRYEVSQANERGIGAEQAADRALGISREIAEFWVRRAVALDLQGRWVEAGVALVQALKLAPTRAGVWYQQAVHLSLNPTENERALAAAGFSLRLDPGNPEAHALRQRLAERSQAP
jgi:O-antigen ligase